MKPSLIVAIVLATTCTGGHAQTVWRCGADGTQFQATPCADGRTMLIEPAPALAAVQEAKEVVQRERLALRALAAERHARDRESMQRGQGPAAIKPIPVAEPRRPKHLPPTPRWKALAPAA